MSWEPADFNVARLLGPQKVRGYAFNGLGLHMELRGSPKGRRAPTWGLYHLNTGHRIILIIGVVAVAFPIATEIAECSDWTFDGLRGWKNRDPDLYEKLCAITERHSSACRHAPGSGSNDDTARAILLAREAA